MGYRKRRYAPRARPSYRTPTYSRRVLLRAHESKFLQGTVSASPSNVATVTALSMPSQGDTIAGRDGDQVQFTSIRGNLQVVAGDATNSVRVMFFQWHPDNNVEAPTIASILLTSSSPTSPLVAAKNARSKFSILWDRMVPVTTSGDQLKILRVNVPMSKFRRTYFNAAATSGKNCLYVAYLSDSGAVTHPSIILDFVYRFRDY